MTNLEALQQIRKIGYASKAEKTQQAVLNMLKTAEAGILEAEKLAKEAADRDGLTDHRTPAAGLHKPQGVSEWAWTHHSFIDLKLWQNCVVACASAGAVDIIGAARKKYAQLGGERVSAYEAEGKTKKEAQPEQGKFVIRQVGALWCAYRNREDADKRRNEVQAASSKKRLLEILEENRP